MTDRYTNRDRVKGCEEEHGWGEYWASGDGEQGVGSAGMCALEVREEGMVSGRMGEKEGVKEGRAGMYVLEVLRGGWSTPPFSSLLARFFGTSCPSSRAVCASPCRAACAASCRVRLPLGRPLVVCALLLCAPCRVHSLLVLFVRSGRRGRERQCGAGDRNVGGGAGEGNGGGGAVQRNGTGAGNGSRKNGLGHGGEGLGKETGLGKYWGEGGFRGTGLSKYWGGGKDGSGR